jgi:hypothetical protein
MINMSDTTGATSEAGTAYHSESPEFIVTFVAVTFYYLGNTVT